MNNELIWVSHPLKESLKGRIIAFLGILIMIAGGYIWLWYYGVFIAIIIAFITLTSFFFPTKYRMDDIGVTVEFFFSKKTYTWDRFKSYYIDNKGILLSPFSSPSRLENFRGIYLRYGFKQNEIKEFVKQKFNV